MLRLVQMFEQIDTAVVCGSLDVLNCSLFMNDDEASAAAGTGDACTGKLSLRSFVARSGSPRSRIRMLLQGQLSLCTVHSKEWLT